MTQSPSGDDPLINALDGLVRAGAIPPARAQAAYEGSMRSEGSPAASEPPRESRQIRLETVAIAIGVGLLGAAVALAASYSRRDSDLDWSNYAVGILATLALLGVSVGTLAMVKDDARRRNLAAWPGAVGAIGAAAMITVGLDDNPATGYVAGLAAALISAAGYYLVRRAALAISAILGLLMVFGSIVNDVVDVTDTQGDSAPLTIAAAAMVFAVAITGAGWKLPSRDTGGIFVGALTIVAYVVVLSVVIAVVSIQQQFAGISAGLDGAPIDAGPDPDRFHDDIYLMLLFTAILVAGWAVCSVLTGHVGYRVLILLMVTSVVPLATAGLAVEHPSWWSVGAGVVGAIALGVVGLRALGIIGDFGRHPPPRPTGGAPINLD